MTVQRISIFIVRTFQIVLLLSIFCKACTLCEENTNCEIVYTSEYGEDLPSSLIWKRDGVDICTCYIGKGCLIYPEFQQEIKASIQLDGGTVTTRVTVLNATRPSGWTGSKWEHFACYDTGTLTLLHTCDLKIYRKINIANCDYQAKDNGLQITCTSTNVYPESACDFSFKINSIYQHYELSPVYKNTVVKQDPVYYKSVCTMDIAKEKLKPGLWEIDAIIFPDIYKNGTNCGLCTSGQIFRFNLTIEMPKLRLLNCPKVVNEGDEIVCICQREDRSDIQTFLYWEIGGTDVKNFNRSASLKAKAWKNITGFTCSASNIFGFLTKVNYSIALNIIEKRCPVDRQNICSNQCFGDGEFCLNGKVYLCEEAKLEEIQKWCRAQNNAFVEAMKFNRCKQECQFLVKMQALEEQLNERERYYTTNVLVSISICLLIICGVCNLVILFKQSQKTHRPSTDASSTPLQMENDRLETYENVNDAGIECTLFVLKKDPVKSSIFEDFTARMFKKLHLYPNQRADKYNVVIRFPDGVEHIMDDEEEFGEDRLERCESVWIVEKRSKRFRKSARQRKLN